MHKQLFALIDIHVNFFICGWLLSSLGHHNAAPGDECPTEYGDMVEYDNEGLARENAIALAKYYVFVGIAKKAVVFVDGDEVFCTKETNL